MFLLAGLAHAVLFGLSFAPVGWSGLALAAPLPLFLAAASGGRCPLRAGVWTGVGTLALWAFVEQWVWTVSTPGYPALVAYLALYPGLFVWLGARMSRRPLPVPRVVALPVIWAGLEVLRGEVVFHGYPWYLLAHPLIDAGPVGRIAQWASVAGVYPVSLLAALPAAAVVEAMAGRRGAVRGLIGLGVFALAIGLAPVGEPPPPGGETLRVAVVQTNVPMDVKLDWSVEEMLGEWESLERLTLEAAGAAPRPDVIVWPETMFPGTTLDPESVAHEREARLAWRVRVGGEERRLPTVWFHDRLLALQGEIGIPMLVGAVDVEGLRFVGEGGGGPPEPRFDARYNSVFVVSGGRVLPERYRKVHLTPFGEVMPYISAWEWLERQLLAIGARGMAFDLSAGEEAVALEVPLEGEGGVARVGTPICFEATMTGVCRGLVFGEGSRGAGVLVNVTNDGWFGGFDGGRRHHFLSARWRSIELRTPMVRAANTGISGWIDAWGRVRVGGSGGGGGGTNLARREGVVVAEVVPGWVVPAYAGLGRVPAWVLLGGGVVLAGLTFRPRGRAEAVERESGAGRSGSEEA